MHSIRRVVSFLALACGGLTGASAGVGVEIDLPTLNRLLGAVTANRFDVALAAGQTMTIELHDLHVTGLAPAASPSQQSAILTSVTLVAPDFGIRMPLRPRVVLGVVREAGGASLLELRFEDTGLAVPLVGRINFARLAPPLRFPADNAFVIDGADGEVSVTSRLTGIEMKSDTIRFEFEVDVPKP